MPYGARMQSFLFQFQALFSGSNDLHVLLLHFYTLRNIQEAFISHHLAGRKKEPGMNRATMRREQVGLRDLF